jgi:hypothetical protein
MPDKYEPTKEEIKMVARVIARAAMGREPDAPSESGDPHWHSYWQAAREALVAAEKVRLEG